MAGKQLVPQPTTVGDTVSRLINSAWPTAGDERREWFRQHAPDQSGWHSFDDEFVGLHWFLWSGMPRAQVRAAAVELKAVLTGVVGEPADEADDPTSDGPGFSTLWKTGTHTIELYFHSGLGRVGDRVIDGDATVQLQLDLTDRADAREVVARSRPEARPTPVEGPMQKYPVLMHTAIDALDCRGLAEFYREFLGLRYRPGDEAPTDGGDNDADWLVLLDDAGNRVFAIQQVPVLARPTWPTHDVPKQMHHDFRVGSVEELESHRRRAEQLGATVLYDRTDDPDEALYVLADPEGHPFCILVGAG